MEAIPYIIAASAASSVASAFSTSAALSSQENSVKLQASQQALAFSQKSLAIIAETKQNIETQAAVASENGLSLASPSLKAISFGTFQKGQTSLSNNQTEAKVAQISSQNEINSLNAQKNILPIATLGKVALDFSTMGSMFGWFNKPVASAAATTSGIPR